VAVSVSIYFASLVEVVVGRRSRRILRHGNTLPETANRRLNEEYVDTISRSLGVGLSDLKYGTGGGQQHSSSKFKVSKSQGKGQYNSDNGRGKGKGKENSGKGFDYSDSRYSDDMSRPSPTEPRKEITEKKKQKNSKRDKHLKLKKSEKASPTYKPIDQPTLKKSEKASPTYKPIDQPTRKPTTDSKFSTKRKSISWYLCKQFSDFLFVFIHLLRRSYHITLRPIDEQAQYAIFFITK